MKQVLIIHGGDFFDSYEEYFQDLDKQEITKEDLIKGDGRRWKDNLPKDLGPGYEVLLPEMPSKLNAKYAEWRIWFEKAFPFLTDGVVLVGHSLGGIFLARYLSENDMPVKVAAVFLIATPHFEKQTGDAGFLITKDLGRLAQQADKVFIYQSEDDDIVTTAHAEKYVKAMPTAIYRLFKDKGHFFSQEHMPELVADIKSL